jgi:hypothetical protein
VRGARSRAARFVFAAASPSRCACIQPLIAPLRTPPARTPLAVRPIGSLRR